ncbi:MAG: RDD family protein [Candidatus Moraniibacteriota bacterium]
MEEQNAINNVGENQAQSVNDNLNQTAMQPSQVAAAAPDMPQVKYAGFWIRWVAVFIDGIVVSVIAIPIMIVFYFLSGGTFSGKDSDMPVGFNFLGYIISWSYYIFMTDKYQATLGKKVMGIIVVAEDLNKLPLGKIILRETIGKIVSGIIFGIGYLMAAFTNKKRALHDIISGTVVIYKEPETKTHRGVIIGVIVVCILFVVVIIGILASIVLVSLSGPKDKYLEEDYNRPAYPAMENVKEL